MRARLRTGIVGPGWAATHHVDAVRRLGYVDVAAMAGSSLKSAQNRCDELSIERAYGDFQDLLDDPDIDVVHNTTPSHMHFSINMAAIEAGKHIVSDKPLALEPWECERLRDAAKSTGVVNAVTFNYRGNSLVQHARQMTAEGRLGALTYIQGHYLQDWMTDPAVYSWRMDVSKGGVSSALSDIGSHWCDLAEHVSGAQIVSVLADLSTAVPVRYQPAAGQNGSFKRGRSIEDRTAMKMHAEDIATVLLRFSNGARGSLRVGQVLPGHKNDLQIEVNGLERSICWRQEQANELWIGSHTQANEVLTKEPHLLLSEAAPYARLPAGHQEGWSDAFLVVVRDIYEWIRAGGAPETRPVTVCDFAQGHRVCCVIHAMLRSYAKGGVWQEVGMVTEQAVASA